MLRIEIIINGEIIMDLQVYEIYLLELPRLHGMIPMKLVDIIEVRLLCEVRIIGREIHIMIIYGDEVEIVEVIICDWM